MWRIIQGLARNTPGFEFLDQEFIGRRVKEPIFTGLERDRDAFNKSFAAMGPKLWNVIPNNLKIVDNEGAFKTSLRGYIRKTFPDTPPLHGYCAKNNNSILTWHMIKSKSHQPIMKSVSLPVMKRVSLPVRNMPIIGAGRLGR